MWTCSVSVTCVPVNLSTSINLNRTSTGCNEEKNACPMQVLSLDFVNSHINGSKHWKLDGNGIVVNEGADKLRMIAVDQSYCNTNYIPEQANTFYVLKSEPSSSRNKKTVFHYARDCVWP